MWEALDLGSAPGDEPCAQLGGDDYYPRARQECRAYIGLLRRTIGPEPEGAELRIRSNPHDFGTYLSVVCAYDANDEMAVTYAFRSEAEAPSEWDEEARRELAANERR